MILLPNRELMQVNSHLSGANLFCKRMKQEREWQGFQNGTVLETAWPGNPIKRLVSWPGWDSRGPFPVAIVQE
jgi:hypothetical protein